MMNSRNLIDIGARLRDQVEPLEFGPPVAFVYNPLNYAWSAHEQYLQRFGSGAKEVLLVGMNPGPFGMTQTGIPFGDIGYVREWLGIEAEFAPPAEQHCKRPVLGFASTRREVSGQRMWGWAKARFNTPEAFFRRFFIWSYCPLCFLSGSGSNITPDKLVGAERSALCKVCDRALTSVIEILAPKYVVGIGHFAEKRIRNVQTGAGPVIGRILHPSPASPKANQNWDKTIESELRALGVTLPG